MPEMTRPQLEKAAWDHAYANYAGHPDHRLTVTTGFVEGAMWAQKQLAEFIDAQGYDEADAAEDSYVDAAVQADQALKDITFLWDWRVNQGYPFLRFTEDVPTMRALLEKTPIEKIPGFEWVKEAREEEQE